MSDLKKQIISAYIQIKKQSNDPYFVITRDFFISQSEFSRRKVADAFGSFTAFKDEAEKEYLAQLSPTQRALLSENNKKYDSEATKDDLIGDLRRVQEDNWGKHITRNFYREHGKYSDSCWSQHFGTFQEFRRQSGLELTRHQHRLERNIAKHASIDHYREFFNTKVLPYYNKYQKPERKHHIKTIMAMSDLHDKECDQFSLSVFIETCRIKQPDVIVLNGDIYDLLEFGKYKVDPRHYDIKGRFNFVKERVYRPLRDACPNAQIDLIAGNHEMRLLKLMADATPNIRILLSDVLDIGFSEIFGLDEFQINWASKFDMGAYSVSDIKNEIKKNYRIYYNCFAFTHLPDSRLKNMSGSNGHHHQGIIQSYNYVDRLSHEVSKFTWSQTPAMHVPDAEYLTNVPGWNTGFLEVVINTLTFEAIQKIHFTMDDWTVIDGVLYERS